MGRKLTTEEFCERARSMHGDRYDHSKIEYVNSRTHVVVVCAKHREFPIAPYNHFIGKGCPKCAGRGLTTDEHIERFREVHGEKYGYSEFGPYKTAKTKYTFICRKHGRFTQTADKHLLGGCARCAIDFRAANRVAGNRETIVADFRKVHGDKYDYSKVDYQNVKQHVTIICPDHGEFEQTPDGHKQGSGCSECKHELLSRLKLKTPEQFLRDAHAVHGDLYDYSKAEYIDGDHEVIIICAEHGGFEQIPRSHLLGTGCPKCAGHGVTTESFIEQCREVHGDKYDYSKTIYRGVFEPVIVGCPQHGEFEPSAKNHRDGTDCPVCGVEKAAKNRRGNKAALFKQRARAVHGDKYDYSKTVYQYARSKLTITCPEHGDFEQDASGHLMGSGCFQCAVDNRVGSYGLTKAIRGDFDDGAPIYLYLVTAVDPDSKQRVYKVGVGNANRIVELRSDMRKAGFDILDSERKLHQSMGEAIVIEQLLHQQLANAQHAVPDHRQFAGYTELFDVPPDYERVEKEELLARFRSGDRWNFNEE